MGNRLSGEQSPYLLQHAENPVDWYPWGEEAFAAANARDKPIFLSIGYSSCHWCHVMAKESFEDNEVARLLNENFISIKVDREERPDVDGVYMAACAALHNGGGWPLTALLTPDQKPFAVICYLPKDHLISLLSKAAQLWREDRGQLISAGDDLTDQLRQPDSTCPRAPDRALLKQAVDTFSNSFDATWGGFGKAPKFPTPHNLMFLLRYSRQSGDPRGQEMAERTLMGMYQGGLFDHVGGGFSRYSTDQRWLVPHFEKMLCDNAMLALAYTEADQHTHKDLYASIARRTLDYVLRELSDPLGGFYCGQDADCEGMEGKFYAFTYRELHKLLGPQGAELFCRWYGVTPEGGFGGKNLNIPHLIGKDDPGHEPKELPTLRRQVYDYRRSRYQLHRDDKVLAAWNGLMIAALARAGSVLDEPRYLEAAERALFFIRLHLTDGDGRLYAGWRAGKASHPGKLNDYAFCAWGLLELYEATFHAPYLAEACRVAELLLTHFFDRNQGGFYPYPSDGEQLLTRTKEGGDGEVPSGNASAALVLSRLARLTGQSQWREAADRQLAWLSGSAKNNPAVHGFTMYVLLEELWPAGELVCAARELPAELTALLRRPPRPGLAVLLKTPQSMEALAALAPFTAEYPIPEQGARYYFCQNQRCRQPTEDISELEQLLSQS